MVDYSSGRLIWLVAKIRPLFQFYGRLLAGYKVGGPQLWFGIPANITSDRGSQFTSSTCQQLEVKHITTSVVDPDPVGSEIICRIRIRIRNYSFRIRQAPIFRG